MVLSVLRLHQVAAQEIVDGRHAAGLGVAPGHALGRRQPLRRQLRRHRIHANFRIEQHMGRVGADGVAPRRPRPAAHDKLVAERCRAQGRRILHAAGVVAEDLEPLAVQAGEPAADQQLPNSMLEEEAADDADPDLFVRSRRRCQRHGRRQLGHDPADQRAVEALQRPVIVSLVGQEERLVGADAGGKRGGHGRYP